jgi:hypothetical protein
MNVEQSMEWELARETEVLGENLPFSPPQIPRDVPGLEPGPPRWEAGD